MIRSLVAVLAGLGCIVVVSAAADAVVLNVFPWAFQGPLGGGAVGLLLVTVGYVTVAAALGGYLTAHVAARHPAQHALALGAVSLALMIAATPFVWESAPMWYHAASLALVIPAAWLGGTLRTREAVRRRPAHPA